MSAFGAASDAMEREAVGRISRWSREFRDPKEERGYRNYRKRHDARQIFLSMVGLSLLYSIGFALDAGLDDSLDLTIVTFARVGGLLLTLGCGVFAIVRPSPLKNDLALRGSYLTFSLMYSYVAYFYSVYADVLQSYVIYAVFIFVVWLLTSASMRTCLAAFMIVFAFAVVNHSFYIKTPTTTVEVYTLIWVFSAGAGYLFARNLQLIPRRDYFMMQSLETEIERRREIEKTLNRH